MGIHCTICWHDRHAYVDRLVEGGSRSLLSIAREVGVSYDALRRHVANEHVARPARVVLGWQADRFPSEAAWLASLARQYGVPVEDMRRHCREGHWRDTPERHRARLTEQGHSASEADAIIRLQEETARAASVAAR